MRNLFKPVATLNLDLSGTNVTTAAWVQVTSSLPAPASAVEIYNASDALMQIAVGGAGNEVALKYTILPGGSVAIIPIEVSGSQRVSVKAVNKTANVGYLVLNFFA
jgi:hypothetical protein